MYVKVCKCIIIIGRKEGISVARNIITDGFAIIKQVTEQNCYDVHNTLIKVCKCIIIIGRKEGIIVTRNVITLSFAIIKQVTEQNCYDVHNNIL